MSSTLHECKASRTKSPLWRWFCPMFPCSCLCDQFLSWLILIPCNFVYLTEDSMKYLDTYVCRYIHGPCCRFCGHQNDEDTRTFCRKFLYNAIASTDNVTAQHKNCCSSGIDDRPSRDLFGVLKRSPISQPHTLGLRRDYSDGKAVATTTGLRRRLHPHWRISLLPSLSRALGQTEASSNF